MKNAELPAMPQNVSINDLGDAETSERAGGAGLTKREMFAMHAMQGLLSNVDIFLSSGNPQKWQNNRGESIASDLLALWSIQCADNLLRELENERA